MPRHHPASLSSRRVFRPRVEECEPRWAPAAGFEVTPTAGLITTEAGAAATFTVRLTEQPTADVIVGVFSSNDAEGFPDVDSLTFTTANWDVPQTVTVTGVDDFVDDGDVAYQIVLDGAQSDDTNYSGLDPEDVAVVNQDDDTAGILVTPLSGLVINEGIRRLLSVQLASEPTDTVTLPIATFGKFAKEAIVKPAQLVFTPDNWNVPQTIRVTGKADAVLNEPKERVGIRIGGALSSDLVYAGRVVNASVTIRDLGLKAFNGTFTGTFTGPVSGGLKVKVAGGIVTITQPAGGSGTIEIIKSSTGTFKYSLTVQGTQISGVGTIKILADGRCTAKGSWTGGGSSGTWQLTRL
jgi:hypothetical protein